jgi:H+/Cl- antiporter ClcA
LPVDEVVTGATTEGIPVAPSMASALEAARVPPERVLVDRRVVFVSVLAVLLALAAGVVAQVLTRLIWLVTNLAFYGRFSAAYASPAGNHLGGWVVVVPVLGGIMVGVMARYGSAAIRGHGIPEAMEQVLLNRSRIPARITLLKPLSAAVAIGTGGPFGAEGPIIATGGALGSLLGQLLRTTAAERKTLLAAGAAAGMAATFGSPVSAVLLAVELLLFELRPRSVIPVAFAAATATGVRIAFSGAAPAFFMPDLRQPHGAALATYVVLGALMFTIGGGLGGALAAVAAAAAPHLGIDARIGALVGMAAMFAGASRALLASVVFAFETTRQPLGLLPLLGGCSAAFLISCLFMRNTIMTEKIARRGVRVPGEYAADFLDQIEAGIAASRPVVSLPGEELLEPVRSRILSGAPGYTHQGFPVVDARGRLAGVLTRRDLLDPVQPGAKRVGDLVRRPAAVAYEDSTLREAADHMVREGVGRLPVVSREDPRKVIGMLTRSDLLSAHKRRLEEIDLSEQHLDLRARLRRKA